MKLLSVSMIFIALLAIPCQVSAASRINKHHNVRLNPGLVAVARKNSQEFVFALLFKMGKVYTEAKDR
jgi:hypothetical protein